MNKHYINIKVDREERPDVDKVYMSFVQVKYLYFFFNVGPPIYLYFGDLNTKLACYSNDVILLSCRLSGF